MKAIPPSTPTGYTIFCDDLRYEIGGKITLVGMYAGDLITPNDFPITLTKLCMRITYQESPYESRDPVFLKIFVPGEETPRFEVTLPREQIDAITIPPAVPEVDNLVTTLFHIETPGMVIKEEGRIRVRAYRGDSEIRLGSLRVVKIRTVESVAS